MELKNYQKSVIKDLTRYLTLLDETGDMVKAYTNLWTEKGVHVGFGGMKIYQNNIECVPNVCLKVPTGGGKTFIAACALKTIFDALPHTKFRTVVWLVPSDAILEQTLGTLSNPQHPYRERINVDFAHRVEVYSKSQLLNGQNFNPTTVSENLCVFVLSYDSFRTSKKEGRKPYQENGNLVAFSKFFNNPDLLLADTDETALIQVIRCLNPVVIVDESHHATSTLSKEMLTNFNPSFILDLTATPKNDSNIISYVDALQLKRENMVKLPVIVYNRKSHNDVLADAITLRRKLEDHAEVARQQTGRYIRPIVLFQAEIKGEDNTTFDKIKKSLIDSGIPESHVKIKIGEKNELRGIDLLAEDCPVRYIITVNALKEGWDCPFAYILATIANRSSSVDVEQILGRVLRLPYTEKNSINVLNISYVLTSSKDFHTTLDKIVAGLNNAGFSEKEYRAPVQGEADEVSVIDDNESTTDNEQLSILPENQSTADIEIDTDVLKAVIDSQDDETTNTVANDMLEQAAQQSDEYDDAVQASEESQLESAPQEVRKYMKVFQVNEEYREQIKTLKLPQFIIPNNSPSLFSDESYVLLEKEALTEGFILRNKDTQIDFSTVEGEIASVDIDNSKAIPKALKITGTDNQIYRKYLDSQPSEKRISNSKEIILKQLSKYNTINDKDLREYISRIFDELTSAQLEDLQQSPHIYTAKIKHKINSLLDKHCKEIFDLWIEQGKISIHPTYSFKSEIAPVKHTSTMSKSLYEAEEEMNELERDVVWELSSKNNNIKWWHRNIANSGFRINGFINAYPDIIAFTESGKILVIEPKGEHLQNEDSKQKAYIGTRWQEIAGLNFKYYMVFRETNLNDRGIVNFEKFKEIVKEL